MIFGSRNKPSFDVLTLSNGRWSKRENLSDRDLALSKARALSQNDRQAEAIRVVQSQVARNGKVTETEILVIDRPEAFQRHEFQVGKVTEVQPCTRLEDLFKLDARRVMERLLRPYLGAQSLTPTEFLHISAYHRQIDRQGNLVASAAHIAARLQSKQDGCNIAERKELLLGFGEQITAMAKEYAAASKQLPDLENQEFIPVANRIAESVPAEKLDFFLTATVCADLTRHRPIDDKLKRSLTLLGASDARGLAILDRIFADCLLSPESLREMLGQQVSLMAQIEQCIKIMGGNFREKTPFGSDFMIVASRMLAAGLCPDTAEAMRLHIIRALDSSTPFDHREPEVNPEMMRLVELSHRLKAEPLLKPAWDQVQDKLDRRRARLANGGW